MVGDSLESIEAIIELAIKHNLQQLQVGTMSLVRSDKVAPPPVSAEDIAKMQKLYEDTKVSDEDILMNPYAGMNNIPRGVKENG